MNYWWVSIEGITLHGQFAVSRARARGIELHRHVISGAWGYGQGQGYMIRYGEVLARDGQARNLHP